MKHRLLSSRQLSALLEEIGLRHEAFLVQVLGPGAVRPKVLKQLQARGLLRPALRDFIRDSYLFGRYAMRDPAVANMSPGQFDGFLARAVTTLDAAGKEAVREQRRLVNEQVSALRDLLRQRVTDAVQAADKLLDASMRGAGPGQLAAEHQGATRALAGRLEEIMRQQLNAASMVVETKVNDAYQRGRLHEGKQMSGQRDPWCFKRPRPDCCAECRKAYLMRDGKTPRLFRLSALVANGSNVGRGRKARLATVDSLHPFCRCEFSYLPLGFGFDKSGTMVYLGRKRGAAA